MKMKLNCLRYCRDGKKKKGSPSRDILEMKFIKFGIFRIDFLWMRNRDF